MRKLGCQGALSRLPVHPVVVFAAVDWAVSVRNCTGPLANRKAALADNLDNEYNREIRDVIEVPTDLKNRANRN